MLLKTHMPFFPTCPAVPPTLAMQGRSELEDHLGFLAAGSIHCRCIVSLGEYFWCITRHSLEKQNRVKQQVFNKFFLNSKKIAVQNENP